MTPQILIISSIILIITILIYQNHDSYYAEKVVLTDFARIDDVLLKTKLETLCPDTRCHLKALEILEKYPTSIHVLFKIYQMTHEMSEYEEALEILKKIKKLLADNKFIEDEIIRMKKKIDYDINLSQDTEVKMYQNPLALIHVPFKIKGYFIFEEIMEISDFPNLDDDLKEIQEKVSLL